MAGGTCKIRSSIIHLRARPFSIFITTLDPEAVAEPIIVLAKRHNDPWNTHKASDSDNRRCACRGNKQKFATCSHEKTSYNMGMPEIICDPGGAFPSGLHVVRESDFEAAARFAPTSSDHFANRVRGGR